MDEYDIKERIAVLEKELKELKAQLPKTLDFSKLLKNVENFKVENGVFISKYLRKSNIKLDDGYYKVINGIAIKNDNEIIDELKLKWDNIIALTPQQVNYIINLYNIMNNKNVNFQYVVVETETYKTIIRATDTYRLKIKTFEAKNDSCIKFFINKDMINFLKLVNNRTVRVMFNKSYIRFSVSDIDIIFKKEIVENYPSFYSIVQPLNLNNEKFEFPNITNNMIKETKLMSDVYRDTACIYGRKIITPVNEYFIKGDTKLNMGINLKYLKDLMKINNKIMINGSKLYVTSSDTTEIGVLMCVGCDLKKYKENQKNN